MNPKRGQVWLQSDGRESRVMGVIDGYVMARFKGCIPWLMPVREFMQLHVPKPSVREEK